MDQEVSPTEVAEGGLPTHLDLDRQLHWLLIRTVGDLTFAFEAVLGNHDLSLALYQTLHAIASQAPEPMPTHQIALHLPGRRPDVTRLVDRLETRKLITRKRRTNDRRQILVGLSAAGRRLFDQVNGSVDGLYREQLGRLTPKQAEQLRELLVCLNKAGAEN